MRRLLVVLAVTVAAMSVATAVPVAAASVGATEDSCRSNWGSQPKTAGSTATSQLGNVRADQHACYDRLVLDFAAKANGYHVRYVTQVTAPWGVIPLRGGAKLQITAAAAAYPDYYDTNPRPYSEQVNVSGWQTFRQVALAGGNESVAHVGLGVRERLPFRVSYLDGPGAASRLVIDVAHRWPSGGTATAAALHVSPATVPAGGVVHVTGAADPNTACLALSPAFLHDADHDFAGVGAVGLTSDATGTFAADAQIPPGLTPGTYKVSARCDGGNLGVSARLVVTGAGAAPIGMPAASAGRPATATPSDVPAASGLGGGTTKPGTGNEKLLLAGIGSLLAAAGAVAFARLRRS